MRTEAQKQAWLENLKEHAKMVDKICELNPDLPLVLNCEQKPLSAWNTAFLYNQTGKKLVMVGGFNQWQKIGKSVKKGEKTIGYISVPMNGNDTEKNESKKLYFKYVPVFSNEQVENILV